MAASGVFATHHMVLVQDLEDRGLKRFFDDYFPGFNIESHAKLAEKARNPFAGQQPNIGTQDGKRRVHDFTRRLPQSQE